MIRCYLPVASWSEEIRLTGDQAHHLRDVLRVKTGDFILCFDGKGSQSKAQVVEVTPQVLLRLGPPGPVKLSSGQISLAAAIPGQGKLDEIINIATQLGVGEVIPLTTERTVVRLEPSRAQQKQKRWTQIAVEAAKQSGSIVLPQIRPVCPWKKFLQEFSAYDLKLIASVQEPHENVRELVAKKSPKTILLAIGPEGDFTPAEIKEASATQFHPISLGPTVLRCETAVAVALGLISFLLREPWKS